LSERNSRRKEKLSRRRSTTMQSIYTRAVVVVLVQIKCQRARTFVSSRHQILRNLPRRTADQKCTSARALQPPKKSDTALKLRARSSYRARANRFGATTPLFSSCHLESTMTTSLQLIYYSFFCSLLPVEKAQTRVVFSRRAEEKDARRELVGDRCRPSGSGRKGERT
jgi:hypothetical protein